MKQHINVAPIANLTKPERIEFLLNHWLDFHETLHAVDHDHEGGGDGDAVTGMPAMFHHPSVVELRRCIDATRKAMPVNCAHLLGFYEAEWRNVTRSEKRKTKKGKLEIVEGRFRERIVPQWIRGQKVKLAFQHVVSLFRGTVHIPSELLEEIKQAA